MQTSKTKKSITKTMTDLNKQCKKCRRAGEKLFLKGERCDSAKCAIIKRNYVPGVHGSTTKRIKLTNYGLQLKEKQKAKRTYGLRETQFRNYFEKAFKKVGNTGELLFTLLELRLDNVIYRLGFVPSRFLSKQIISHGHITINGKKVDIPSYQVKTGDIISLKESSQKKKLFIDIKETLKKKDNLVSWLSLDTNEIKGKVTSKPKTSDSAANINWRTIVEFYSK